MILNELWYKPITIRSSMRYNKSRPGRAGAGGRDLGIRSRGLVVGDRGLGVGDRGLGVGDRGLGVGDQELGIGGPGVAGQESDQRSGVGG
jgi:hypothetical protein